MKALVILLVILSRQVLAQDYPRDNIDLQRIADDLYSVQELDMNYEEIFENLALLLAQPIDLNQAKFDDLTFLKILSDEQINNLLLYRKEQGKFLSIYELQSVPGFELATIYALVPFVTVDNPENAVDVSLWKRFRNDADRYIIVRYDRSLQEKKGFTDEVKPEEKFQGSPDKLYIRLRSSRPGDFSIGLTAEKDAGEAFTWSPTTRQYGIDYLSFHLQLQNKGRLKNFIVGDFQNQFGQGLALGGIFGMGKGGETITTTRRSNIGHLPYTSAYETGQLRGVAATVELTSNLYLHPFYSHLKRDATLELDEDQQTLVTSFQNTGLHRNEKELSKRKRIGEQNVGGVLQYKKGTLDVGLIYNRFNFDSPVQKNESIYNQYAFSGKQNQNLGIYANYSIQNFALFGEASHTFGFGSAYVVGFLTNAEKKFDLAILFRNFSRDYHAFYSNAFAEGSVTQNERGVYWGWKYTFSRRYAVAGYLDLFKFPWLKYRTYVPSTGHEALLRFTYQPNRKTILFAQLREENKVQNIGNPSDQLYTTTTATKRNFWISAEYPVNDALRLKTRVQLSSFTITHKTSMGSALVQDIRWQHGKIELTARYALFDTDDYDNRQYVYENDVWLAYALPAYAGSGIRNYLMIEYKVNQYLSLWLRYAHTRYTDRDEISSGVDSIEGSVQDDFKFQACVKF